MRFENLVARQRRLNAIQQRTKALENAAFPIYQRAVAVECQGIEVGQLHGDPRCQMGQ
jgi:hypothetical protein